ncbi:MAG: S8 family serine peptidase [Bacteroidota bacterium]|nr:S8 family serine peptidase [Bacteroidota bacterium]
MTRRLFLLLLSLAIARGYAQFPTGEGGPFDPALCVSAPVYPTDTVLARIDARLHPLVHAETMMRKPLEASSAAARMLVPLDGSGDISRVPVFVRANDVEGASHALVAAGAEVTTRSGNILVARIPLASLRDIALHRAIECIQAAQYLEPALDVSRREIQADAVHTGVNLPCPYTGRGVVVGVVDSGIDWRHPDFTVPGASRIQYIWDMSDSVSTVTSPPPEYGYGREYTRMQIEAGVCRERDLPDGSGHGTHVTGTAAGNGRMNGEYTGIAPDADIVFVKGFRSAPGFVDTDVIDGCDFIFKRAARLGKPAVINLSLGGHSGAHDGRTLYEAALEAMTGPGRIIVAAAGNDGDKRVHLHYTTGGDRSKPRVTFLRADDGASGFAIDLWYSGGPVDVGLAWYSNAPSLAGYVDAVRGGNTVFPIPIRFGAGIPAIAGITNLASDPSNGMGHAVVFVAAADAQVDLSTMLFGLYTHGSGTLDAWIRGGEFAPNAHPWHCIMPGDYSSTVMIPATARRIIAVGSYVTKDHWTDLTGIVQRQQGNPVVGARSFFSSIGPTGDGRLKPDISAPGEVILSALSGDCGAEEKAILFGGGYLKMQGTSMAAPHVTGTVALMLERNPALDVSDVLDALTRSARTDRFTGSVPNMQFGYGKINALAAVQRVTPLKEGDSAPGEFSVSAAPNPVPRAVRFMYRLPTREHVVFCVFDALGRHVGTIVDAEAGPGEHRIVFDFSALPPGVFQYVFQAGCFTRRGCLVHCR